MCGINGIFSKKKLNLRERISKMNDSIFIGVLIQAELYIKDSIGLGHRRLSIIDIRDVSNQPMESNSGRFSIVFNGEIYNFKEIKKKLNIQF